MNNNARASLDDVSIFFSEQSLIFLNICLGFIMFGIALGINLSDFRRILIQPKAAILGAISQFLLLPAATFLLVLAIKPHPSIALGMLLVAACPGGNVSNYISALAGANVALSVSLTALSTLITPLATPLNFEFWSGHLPYAATLLESFSISFTEMLGSVLLVLVIPLIMGLVVQNKLPKLTVFIQKPFRIVSFLILVGFIAGALANNFQVFLDYFPVVVSLVFVHNALAFALGYLTGMAGKVPVQDRRTLAIETGIQNSGLGLILIFTFFKGNGGMALIAAWWGIWHIIAGLTLTAMFRWADRRSSRAHAT